MTFYIHLVHSMWSNIGTGLLKFQFDATYETSPFCYFSREYWRFPILLLISILFGKIPAISSMKVSSAKRDLRLD